MRVDVDKARGVIREKTGITVEPFEDFVGLVQAVVDAHEDTETGPALLAASGRVTELEEELAQVRGERDDLVAFLKVASWRYGGVVASMYAEGWRACAVAALDWIDKHQERKAD